MGDQRGKREKWIRDVKEWVVRACAARTNEKTGREDVISYRKRRQDQMSSIAAHMRNREKMEQFLKESEEEAEHFFERVTIEDTRQFSLLFRTYDMVLTQWALLSAMIQSADTFGSRGGAVVEDKKQRKKQECMENNKQVEWKKQAKIVTRWDKVQFVSTLEAVKPIPEEEGWFESVWAEYRKRNGL